MARYKVKATLDNHCNLQVARGLIRRYSVALVLIGSLSTAAWVSLRLVISEQESTAAIVNVSGRQRMLSQRTALFAHLLVDRPASERESIRKTLSQAIELMANSHQGLIQGDKTKSLPAVHSPIVHAMYFDGENPLNSQVIHYIRSVRQWLALENDELRQDHPLLLDITATASTSLVAGLDAMVQQYQREGEQSVKTLEKAETALWLITLCLLVLEAMLIFQPFVRHIRAVIGQLQQVTDELQTNKSQLEQVVQQRTRELECRTKELEESLQTFNLINTVAQDAIVMLDEQANIVHWNPAAEKIFGYTSAEAIGQNLHNLIAPIRYRDIANKAYAQFALTGEGNFVGKTVVINSLHRDASEFTIELSISAMKLQNTWHSLSIIRDISERQQIDDALRQNEEQLRLVLEGAELGFWDWNVTTGEVTRNERWAKMLGYRLEEIQHTTQQWTDFIHPDDRAAAWQSIMDVIEGRSAAHKLEYRMLHKDGSIRWILDQANVMQRDASGKPTRMSGIHSDITLRKNMEMELIRQARTDPLTGISNRRYFMEQAELELASAHRYQNPLTLLMLDVDLFKSINDTHGHKAGDAALQKLAKVCRETLREIDIVGRLGGEEFAILLPQTEPEQALEAAERLRLALANARIHLDGEEIGFTVSIGLATLDAKHDTIDNLIHCADQALYVAKRSGRNRICVDQQASNTRTVVPNPYMGERGREARND